MAVVRKEDGTVVCADCVVADSAWSRSKGLLGRSSLGEDEGILLRPGKVIDATQAWFWATGWQRGEREGADDLRAGRSTVFESSDDFLASLDD